MGWDYKFLRENVVPCLFRLMGICFDDAVRSSHELHKPSYLYSERGCEKQVFHLDNSIATMVPFSIQHRSFNVILALGNECYIDVLSDENGNPIKYFHKKATYGVFKKMVKKHKHNTIHIKKGHFFIFRYDYVHAGSAWHGEDNCRIVCTFTIGCT